MKHLHFILYIILFIGFTACHQNKKEKLPLDLIQNPNTAQGKDVNTNVPEITFEEREHDFGKVYAGEKVSYVFKYKNTGKADLIVSNVSTSCGCTASNYTKEPLKPGSEGEIKITFDSKGRSGRQAKTITVSTNAQPGTYSLRIKADVNKP